MLDSRVMQVQLCSGSGLLGMEMLLLLLRLMVFALLLVVFVTCGQPRGALCHGRDAVSICGARLGAAEAGQARNACKEMNVLL